MTWLSPVLVVVDFRLDHMSSSVSGHMHLCVDMCVCTQACVRACIVVHMLLLFP